MTFVPAMDNGRFFEIWAALEHAYRVKILMDDRGMSLKAATTVVDAAMLGEGCTEGSARVRIQKEIEAESDMERDRR